MQKKNVWISSTVIANLKRNTNRKDEFLGNLSWVLGFWVRQNGGSTHQHVKYMWNPKMAAGSPTNRALNCPKAVAYQGLPGNTAEQGEPGRAADRLFEISPGGLIGHRGLRGTVTGLNGRVVPRLWTPPPPPPPHAASANRQKAWHGVGGVTQEAGRCAKAWHRCLLCAVDSRMANRHIIATPTPPHPPKPRNQEPRAFGTRRRFTCQLRGCPGASRSSKSSFLWGVLRRLFQSCNP